MAAESRRSAYTGKMILVFLAFLISIADAKPQFMYSAQPIQHGHKQRAVTRNVRQNPASYHHQLQPIAAYTSPLTHNRQYRDDTLQATQVTYENAPIIQEQTPFVEQEQQYVAADVNTLTNANTYTNAVDNANTITNAVENVESVNSDAVSAEAAAVKKPDAEKEDETFYTCCIPIGHCRFRIPKEPAGKPNEKCQCWNCQGPPFWPPYPGPWMPGPECGCPLECPPPMWNAKGKNCNWMNDCNFDGGNFGGCDFMPCCNIEWPPKCENKTTTPCVKPTPPVCKPDGKPCSCHNFGGGCPHGCDDGWEMGIGFICQKCKAKDCFKPPQHNFGCHHHGGPHHFNNPSVFDMMYDSPYYY